MLSSEVPCQVFLSLSGPLAIMLVRIAVYKFVRPGLTTCSICDQQCHSYSAFYVSPMKQMQFQKAVKHPTRDKGFCKHWCIYLLISVVHVDLIFASATVTLMINPCKIYRLNHINWRQRESSKRTAYRTWVPLCIVESPKYNVVLMLRGLQVVASMRGYNLKYKDQPT